MTNDKAITLSVSQIIYFIIGLSVLYFVIIRPAIARGVCYNEAGRLELFRPEPQREAGWEAFQKRVDKRYHECKVYNAGKEWEVIIFNNLKL